MEKPHHRLSDLFAQLGLASDASSIRKFIERHSPLDDATRIEEAPCWNSAQSKLLREGIAQDADWAEVADQLNVALRAPHSR